jgi:hypothetical protein|tara:strand:- start:7707 stop:7862 length:156 start_codon:yes stop_codon:yes gene_type:complete
LFLRTGKTLAFFGISITTHNVNAMRHAFAPTFLTNQYSRYPLRVTGLSEER